ncbi:chondroitin sulfate synthase 2 [Cydia fagiglandana]|uniref:chondroitin sulfate synthase 2 n=1 Tax=Cydia fagiglandana TaxID=1458189 RepID=UPI002FEE608F
MLSRYVVSQVKHNGYFLAGLALGLWLALATVPLDDAPTCAAPSLPVLDDYEPQREERPDHAAVAAGRAVQRPRYYSTELGMRAPLLAGVLAGAVDARSTAINDTAHVLQPALKFFITADSRQASSGLANVVGFTDSRALLRPFHALKYLADNFLDEYDFFFLSADNAYINARRLKQLVASISVSQDVYMGMVEGDSQYCLLESGILLSNSVLRAVHNALDWCVRNSYSPHHHENLGRCVLHAARTPCTNNMQGETYVSATLSDPLQLTPSLADAVTAHPATPPQMYSLHAYVSSVLLTRAKDETRALRRALHRGIRSHPPGFRNGTWPGGLRSEPGLAAPAPDSRFDHPRWLSFNRTHAYMLDDLAAVRPLPRAHTAALDMVWETARAWALRQYGAREAALVEGAMRWEPATALKYRLLVRLTGDKDSVWETARAWALRQYGAREAALVEGAMRWEPATALKYRLLVRLTGDKDSGQMVWETARAWALRQYGAREAALVEGAMRWEPATALKYRLLVRLTGDKDSGQMVWETARAWALRQYGAREAALVEGAMRWEPATALKYRLLVRLTGDKDSGQAVRLRQLEVVRPLGAARLAPVPYVTESARVALVLPVLLTQHAEQQQLDDAAAFLTRYESVCLNKDKNTNLVIVLVTEGTEPEQATSLRSAAAATANRHRANIEVLSATLTSADETELQRAARAGRAALETPRQYRGPVSHTDVCRRDRATTSGARWKSSFRGPVSHTDVCRRDRATASGARWKSGFRGNNQHLRSYFMLLCRNNRRMEPSNANNRHRANIEVLSATLTSVDETELQRAARAGRAALEAGLARLPRDALVLLADVAMEFNEEFLNRARMNSISGVQWFLPSAFARYNTYTHPKVVAPDGSRPQHHTGRFTPRGPVLAVYKQDYMLAVSEWRASGGSESASAASILAASRLRAIRAPEPGLVLQPSAPPCRYSEDRGSCLSKLREAGEFELLELGAKHALAKLELEVKAELE